MGLHVHCHRRHEPRHGVAGAVFGPILGTVNLGSVQVIERSVITKTDAWRRSLALLLDGLRATERPALPGPPPNYDSLDDVIAVSKPRPR